MYSFTCYLSCLVHESQTYQISPLYLHQRLIKANSFIHIVKIVVKKVIKSSKKCLKYACLLFITSWLHGQRLLPFNQFVTSFPLYLLTLPRPSTQISVHAICPLSTITYLLLRDELKVQLTQFPTTTNP